MSKKVRDYIIARLTMELCDRCISSIEFYDKNTKTYCELDGYLTEEEYAELESYIEALKEQRG